LSPLATAREGCRFRPRCPVGRDREICRVAEPPLEEKTAGHWVACHFAGELATAGFQPSGDRYVGNGEPTNKTDLFGELR
jgi:hypothetical protein